MKKHISILLVCLMLVLLPVLGMEADAAEIIYSGTCGENLTWVLDSEGTLTISGSGAVESYVSWPMDQTLVKTLVINDGVTDIGSSAFAYFYNLASVTIPDSVTSIGYAAFNACGSLTSIIIPEYVTSIDIYAFVGCESLTDVYYGGTSTQWDDLFSHNSFPDITPRVHCGCISAEGHWTTVTIPATCGSDGLVLERCDCIFTRNQTSLPATGEHSYTAVVAPPTCIEAGCTTYTCAECGDIYTDEYVAELGHDMGEWVTTEAATVTAKGTERRDCEACDYFETRETDMLPVEKTNPFADVFEQDYFYASVQWAVESSITNGMDDKHFAPGDTCTRGQIVTFLWRANGSPEPVDGYNPFLDVKLNDYYYKAVLWAVENGITSGMGEGVFAPAEPCTRGQVATFLWRSEKQPTATAVSSFLDVASDAYYYSSVLWAVENGITNGMGDGTFAPNAPCTRGQIVTFLYRAEGFDRVETTGSVQYMYSLVDRSYYNQAGLLRILYTYDKIEVLGQTDVAKKINGYIDQDVYGFLGRLSQEDLEEYAVRPWLEAGDYFWYTAESEVTNNTNGVFSICVTTDWMMGGVHNLDYYGLNFDLNTGKEIDLATLLGMDETGLTGKLKDTAWAYLSQNYKDAMFEDAYETLYGYTYDDFLYYFRDNELILTFPTYALSHGAAGAFTVPTGLYI